jgi:hypothetical protein
VVGRRHIDVAPIVALSLFGIPCPDLDASRAFDDFDGHQCEQLARVGVTDAMRDLRNHDRRRVTAARDDGDVAGDVVQLDGAARSDLDSLGLPVGLLEAVLVPVPLIARDRPHSIADGVGLGLCCRWRGRRQNGCHNGEKKNVSCVDHVRLVYRVSVSRRPGVTRPPDCRG